MTWDILSSIVGALFTIIVIVVKDAVMKNTLKHEIKSLRDNYELRSKIDDRQDAEIKRLEAEVLSMRERQISLREKMEANEKFIFEELRGHKDAAHELAQSVAALKATLDGLQGWLKRIDQKLDSKRRS